MSGETLNSVLVIDNGSSACRAGLSGDIVPSICFPLELDRPLHQKLVKLIFNSILLKK